MWSQLRTCQVSCLHLRRLRWNRANEIKFADSADQTNQTLSVSNTEDMSKEPLFICWHTQTHTHRDRQTDRQTDMLKSIPAFSTATCNYKNNINRQQIHPNPSSNSTTTGRSYLQETTTTDGSYCCRCPTEIIATSRSYLQDLYQCHACCIRHIFTENSHKIESVFEITAAIWSWTSTLNWH